jgi:hypothetical protein
MEFGVSQRETERGLRAVERSLSYPTIGGLSFLAVTVLEMLGAGLEGVLLRTEIYSIHGFSHIFFGIGLASVILFLRPRATAKVVILAVLVAGLAWELHEGHWLRGEPIDSVEDVVLAILSASTFLCFTRRKDREPGSTWQDPLTRWLTASTHLHVLSFACLFSFLTVEAPRTPTIDDSANETAHVKRPRNDREPLKVTQPHSAPSRASKLVLFAMSFFDQITRRSSR